MNKWEREFKIAELIAESEEQQRFDEFYAKIPNVVIRHKTQESHLPLISISSAEGKRSEDENMQKMFCDRCGKELDNKNMKFVRLSIYNYADEDSDLEHWDFCHECASSIKHSILKNIAEYENKKDK